MIHQIHLPLCCIPLSKHNMCGAASQVLVIQENHSERSMVDMDLQPELDPAEEHTGYHHDDPITESRGDFDITTWFRRWRLCTIRTRRTDFWSSYIPKCWLVGSSDTTGVPLFCFESFLLNGRFHCHSFTLINMESHFYQDTWVSLHSNDHRSLHAFDYLKCHIICTAILRNAAVCLGSHLLQLVTGGATQQHNTPIDFSDCWQTVRLYLPWLWDVILSEVQPCQPCSVQAWSLEEAMLCLQDCSVWAVNSVLWLLVVMLTLHQRLQMSGDDVMLGTTFPRVLRS